MARPSSSHSGFDNAGNILSSGSITGIVIAIIIALFIIAYIYQYYKARKVRAEKGTPIPHGKIFVNSLLIALFVGLIYVLFESCCGDNDSSGTDVEAGNGGGGGAPEPAQPVPEMAQPTFQQPGMNWEPINNAAKDPVQ